MNTATARRTGPWLVFAIGLALPSAGFADAIGPNTRYPPGPSDCPSGAFSMSGTHGRGPHCLASRCESASDCRGDTGPCEERGLCIRMQGGGHSGPYPTAPRACTTDADCEGLTGGFGPNPQTVRCMLARRCAGLPGPVVPPPAAVADLLGPQRAQPLDPFGSPEDDPRTAATAGPDEPATTEEAADPGTEEAVREASSGDVPAESGGCGCRIASAESAPMIAGLFAIPLWLLGRRRQ